MKDQELIESVYALSVAEENMLLANAPCRCWSCLLHTDDKTKVEPCHLS